MFLLIFVFYIFQNCDGELLTGEKLKHNVPLKDISKLVPLNFVADTDGVGEFDPEKSGILLHEYFDQIYEKFPQYKTFKQLQDELVLTVDPLKNQNNPYADAAKKFKWFLESIYQDNGVKPDSEKSGKKDVRFQLDSAEVEEYTRPTVPPLSDVQIPEDVDDSDNLYDGDNINLTSEEDEDNFNEFER